MTFSKTWDESDPDGDVVRVSGLDDSVRATKAAVRERLEGDPADPYSGIFESGSFSSTARIRKGTGRIHVDTEANIPGLPKIDGALAISSDKQRLYHLKADGLIEVGYLNLDGSRAMASDLKMGNKKVTGMAKGTVAGDAVEFSQAALIDQQRTITNLWTFNRGSGAPFAVPSGSAKVANLDADKLDGHDAADFVLASEANSQVKAGYTANAETFGTTYASITGLSLVLPSSGVWVFRYSLMVTITGAFNVRTTGAALALLRWIRGSSSGQGSTIAESGTGVLDITAFISGSSGDTINLQMQAGAGTGTVGQFSTFTATKV